MDGGGAQAARGARRRRGARLAAHRVALAQRGLFGAEREVAGRTYGAANFPLTLFPRSVGRACPQGVGRPGPTATELTRPGAVTGYYKLQRDKAAGAESVAPAAPPAAHSLAGVDADAPWTVFWDCLEARGWTCTQGRRKGIDFLYAPPGSKPHPPYRLRVVSARPEQPFASLRI